MYKKITLELSLKPFKRTDDEYIKSVCEKIFNQWRPLVKDCETLSIMFWAADGSEILDYAGNMDDEFEWCKYIGTANLPDNPTDDHSIGLYIYKYEYMENPPVMTYAILKKIAGYLKSEGERLLGKRIHIGTTFDIGPEFAKSDFKYNRHREACGNAGIVGEGSFLDCTATLHADTRKYAAYPDGIPEGEPLGRFLGKQTTAFLRDMEMDFIWLSNGFGFSANPWDLSGKIFDGERFYPEKLGRTREKVFEFWKYFREGCPDYPVQVRGTNNSVGIDYATDAVPIYDIYKGGFNITPPPNSPWAALNDNYGLEIMGHMTRICELPGDEFMFRFYIHDPWWVNSPWYDRYGGEPIDIYMPSAVTRINEEGKVESAEILNFLSIDNSFGEMPDACVNEVIPHIIKAKKNAGDKPAPLVWVYPIREFSTATDEKSLSEMFYGDKFICEAINNSFPLNCVVSTDNFLKTSLSIYKSSVLISPVPENDAVREKIGEFIKNGGRVIFYGSAEKLACLCKVGAEKVDIASSPVAIREALAKFGYEIGFMHYAEGKKTTTMTIANSDNAMFFSLYNQTTALDMELKFPLGAPVFIGTDAIMEEGKAVYRFGRCEHLETRFFVKQEDGVVTAREEPPISKKHRRKLALFGLRDATVCYFPEAYCAEDSLVGFRTTPHNATPEPDERFKLVRDPIYGTYYKGEHITGDYYFYMPEVEYLK